MNPGLTDAVREFLRRPNPAVMATVRANGQPVSVATWYLLLDDDQILLNLDASRVRLKHLQRDGRVALTALDGGNWYTHVSIQGTVTSITSDTGLADIDALSRHYGGQPYAIRDQPRVSVHVRIDSVHGWGAMGGR